jgi:hypothetical protein
VGVEYYPLHTGDPALTNSFDRLLGQEALQQDTMSLGLFDARVSKCAPRHDLFLCGDSLQHQRPNGPVPALRPAAPGDDRAGNFFVLDSAQLLVTLNDAAPAGAIITLSTPGTPAFWRP